MFTKTNGKSIVVVGHIHKLSVTLYSIQEIFIAWSGCGLIFYMFFKIVTKTKIDKSPDYFSRTNIL